MKWIKIVHHNLLCEFHLWRYAKGKSIDIISKHFELGMKHYDKVTLIKKGSID